MQAGGRSIGLALLRWGLGDGTNSSPEQAPVLRPTGLLARAESMTADRFPAGTCVPPAFPAAPPMLRLEPAAPVPHPQMDLGELLHDLSPFVRTPMRAAAHPAEVRAAARAASATPLRVVAAVARRVVEPASAKPAATALPAAAAACVKWDWVAELAGVVAERDAAIARAEAAEEENGRMRDKLGRAAESFKVAQARLGAAGEGWHRLGAAVSECRHQNGQLEAELAEARRALARQKKAYYLKRGARLRQNDGAGAAAAAGWDGAVEQTAPPRGVVGEAGRAGTHAMGAVPAAEVPPPAAMDTMLAGKPARLGEAPGGSRNGKQQGPAPETPAAARLAKQREMVDGLIQSAHQELARVRAQFREQHQAGGTTSTGGTRGAVAAKVELNLASTQG